MGTGTDTGPGDETEDVRRLLGAAGIDAPDGDIASLTRMLPGIRRRVDRMYDVDTGDEVTAAVFRAGVEVQGDQP